MIMWGRHTSAEIAAVIKDSLKEIAETTTWEDVPGTTIESCGNYKDHSLFSAKEWANSSSNKESQTMPLNVMSSKQKKETSF